MGGFDGSGTHGGDSSIFPQPNREIFTQNRLPGSLTFPEKIVIDATAFDSIKAFIRAQGSVSRARVMTRIYKRIRNHLHNLQHIYRLV